MHVLVRLFNEISLSTVKKSDKSCAAVITAEKKAFRAKPCETLAAACSEATWRASFSLE